MLKLNFHFIDNEDLFFPKTDANYTYASPRPRKEVEMLLMDEVKAHKIFVFASVNGDYGKDILPLYNYAVLIDVPKEVRMRRVKNRSFLKFGDRMLNGGDLYEQEAGFFDLISARPENYVEEWALSLNCHIIRVDGTKPIDENLTYIIERLLK